MPLDENDIKSELSYAYLHAVASRAGCECQVSHRHSDNRGIDVRLMVTEDFGPPATLSLFDVYVQLKATTRQLKPAKQKIPFDLEVAQYNKLRMTTAGNPWLLILLLLPASEEEWLKCTPQALTLKRCTYWVSLDGAPATANKDTQRIYIPTKNRFTVTSLRALLSIFAREEVVAYED
jgi:hypothetical protein